MSVTDPQAAGRQRVFRTVALDELDARADDFGRLLLDALLRAMPESGD